MELLPALELIGDRQAADSERHWGRGFFKQAQGVLPPEDLQRIENARNNFVRNAAAARIFKPEATRSHIVGAIKGKPSRKLMQLAL